MKKGFVKVISALLIVMMLVGGASTVAFAAAYGELEGTAVRADVPASFNNDPYNLPNYITSVKYQDQMGLCWAYSAVSCAEADAIKNGGSDVPANLDLSEWHLAYFTYFGSRTGTGDTVSIKGSTPYYDLGGYSDAIPMVLSNKIGFVTEDKAPMDDLLNDRNAKLDMSLMYECDYQLENAYCYDPKTEIDELKLAITQYGSALINYYSGDEYYNKNYAAQYCDDSNALSDHAVTIVGWDDDYSRTKFAYGCRPSSNGAWLVKNSWGESFGLGGYFWLSYEDASVCEALVFDVEKVNNDETVYSHDGGTSMTFFPVNMNEPMANIFTVDSYSSELLTAVGVDVREAPGKSSKYQIDIYVNPVISMADKYQYHINSIPTRSFTGEFHNGFNKIELDNPLALKNGDRVVVSVASDTYLLIDMDWQSEDGLIISDAGVDPEQTILYDETEKYWGDRYNAPIGKEDERYNARIKMYTQKSDKKTPFVIDSPELYIDYGTYLTGDMAASIVNSSSRVVDPDNMNAEVLGTWIAGDGFDAGKKYYNGDTVTFIFMPFDTKNYNSVTEIVTVYTNAVPFDASLDIKTSSPYGEVYVGDNVTVNLLLSDGIDLSSLKDYEFYYEVNGKKDYSQSSSFSFTVKEEMRGETIIIGFIYRGEEYKYHGISIVENLFVSHNDNNYMPEYEYPSYEDEWFVSNDNGGYGGGGNSSVDIGKIALVAGAIVAVIAVVAAVVIGGGVTLLGGAAVIGGSGVGIFFIIKSIVRSIRYNRNYW